MMRFDAPFLYTVGKTNRERVFSMYEGKYTAKKNHRPARWLSACLYGLNILLLVFATVRVFAWGGAAATENSIPETEPEVQITQPQSPKGTDSTPPVMEGVRDITVYAGDTVAYRSGGMIAQWLDTVTEAAVMVELPGNPGHEQYVSRVSQKLIQALELVIDQRF